MEDRRKHSCSHRAGHVSDPPGFLFYFEMGKDKLGLSIYRCSRGTKVNSVEDGIHQNIIRKFGSFGACPHLADCALADYRLRHNIDVGNLLYNFLSANLSFDYCYCRLGLPID